MDKEGEKVRIDVQMAGLHLEEIIVDAITSNSESDNADEDVNQISDDEVSPTAEEQLPMEGESDEEQ